jgi:hypothetical protein
MKKRPEPIIDKLIERAQQFDCFAEIRFHMAGNARPDYVPPPPAATYDIDGGQQFVAA